MAMVTERSDVKECFVREWEKFVPAIIACGKKCTKPSVKAIFTDIHESGKL